MEVVIGYGRPSLFGFVFEVRDQYPDSFRVELIE